MGLILVNGTALSVSANATSSEQVSSSTYQFVPFTGTAFLAARGSATGLNIQLAAAGQTLCNDQAIPYTGTAGAISMVDHQVVDFPVEAGSRIELKFRNTTGGALTVDYILTLEPDGE
jgi:hypothetical protein